MKHTLWCAWNVISTSWRASIPPVTSVQRSMILWIQLKWKLKCNYMWMIRHRVYLSFSLNAIQPFKKQLTAYYQPSIKINIGVSKLISKPIWISAWKNVYIAACVWLCSSHWYTFLQSTSDVASIWCIFCFNYFINKIEFSS